MFTACGIFLLFSIPINVADVSFSRALNGESNTDVSFDFGRSSVCPLSVSKLLMLGDRKSGFSVFKFWPILKSFGEEFDRTDLILSLLFRFLTSFGRAETSEEDLNIFVYDSRLKKWCRLLSPKIRLFAKKCFRSIVSVEYQNGWHALSMQSRWRFASHWRCISWFNEDNETDPGWKWWGQSNVLFLFVSTLPIGLGLAKMSSIENGVICFWKEAVLILWHKKSFEVPIATISLSHFNEIIRYSLNSKNA